MIGDGFTDDHSPASADGESAVTVTLGRALNDPRSSR